MTTLSEHIEKMMKTRDFSQVITEITIIADAVLYLLEHAEREDKAIDAKYGMHVDGNNDEYLKVLKMAEDAGVADDIRRKEAIRVLEFVNKCTTGSFGSVSGCTCELCQAIERLKNGGKL